MNKKCAILSWTLFLLTISACHFDNGTNVVHDNSGVRGSIDWNKPFNLIRLDLAENRLPLLEKRTLVALQKNMWQKGVPINPAHFLPLPKEEPANNIDEQEWKRFLESLPKDKRPPLDMMMRNIEFLTYDQLERALASFATVFDQLVNDDYSIGLNMNKSSQWLASILLPYVAKKPKSAFVNPVDTYANLGTDNDLLLLLRKVSTDYLVIVDDASYSGNQLFSIIHGVNLALSGRTVIIFVAFATKEAMELLEKQALTPLNKNRVIVVTTKTPTKTIRDVISKEEFVGLFDATKLVAGDIRNLFEAARCYSEWTLMHPAWKTPDAVSFPDFLVVSQLKKDLDGEIEVKGFAQITRLKHWNVVKKDDSYFLFRPQIKPPYKQIALTKDLGI